MEHFVYQSGFTVVNVCNNRNVSDGLHVMAIFFKAAKVAFLLMQKL
jgi:hypothetical protein